MTSENLNTSTEYVGTSKELVYCNHIFNVMNRAMTSFDEFEYEKFDLYVSYLEAALLDDSVLKQIKTEKARLYAELIKEQKETGSPNQTTIRFRLGFLTIKYVFRYLNDVLELSSTDIIGPVSQDFYPEKVMTNE